MKTQDILKGYTVEQSISGYWRLLKGDDVIIDDSAYEDYNEDRETAEAAFRAYLKENQDRYAVCYDNNVECTERGRFDTPELAQKYADDQVEGEDECGVGAEDPGRATTYRYCVYDLQDEDDPLEIYSTNYYYAE